MCLPAFLPFFFVFFSPFFHVFLLFIGTSAKESKGKGVPLQRVTPFMTPSDSNVSKSLLNTNQVLEQ